MHGGGRAQLERGRSPGIAPALSLSDLKNAHGPVGYCANASYGTVSITRQPHQIYTDAHATVKVKFSRKSYAGTSATCHVPTKKGAINSSLPVTCEGVINGVFGANDHEYDYTPGCFSYDDGTWAPALVKNKASTYEYGQCTNCDDWDKFEE